MSNFPTSLDNLTNPAPTSNMATLSHSAQHSNANDAIEAIEAAIGITGSTDPNSLEYKKVPYSGATANVNLGAHTLATDAVIHNTTYSPTGSEAIGTQYWDDAEKTLQFVVEGGSIDVNKELFDIYVDNSISGLAEGNVISVVSISGNRQAVDKTNAATRASATACIGMVTYVNANHTVRVTKQGRVHKLNTNGMTEGLPIYVNPATPGAFTQTPPSAPNYFIHVGIVEVANTNNGIIDVDIRISPSMIDLSDVNGTSLTTTGQLPVWNQTSGYFDFDYNIYRDKVVSKNTNYTLLPTNQIVVFTATATATLPAATGSGQTFRIICRAGTLTIDGNGSDTIVGELTQALYAGENLILTDIESGKWE